jgi:hypothetical protein
MAATWDFTHDYKDQVGTALPWINLYSDCAIGPVLPCGAIITTRHCGAGTKARRAQ